MYKLLEWSPDLNLEEFYRQAERRGFYNNSSQHMLVDCFFKETSWCVWILYYNGNPVGSVAAHSFDDVMGPGSFRIAARTCIFSDMVPFNRLRTLNEIITHQNITSQFFIPACIEWAPKNSRLFITTNENEVGTQRLVHKIFAPAMEKSKQMQRIKDVDYRGTVQTIWELYPEKFYQELNKHPIWKLEK
jgi:hypothetical protein